MPIAGSPVFVVGEPSYYTRFGFRRVRQPVCPFEPSNEHFMALHYDSQDEFQVGYEPEFLMGEPTTAPNAGVVEGPSPVS